MKYEQPESFVKLDAVRQEAALESFNPMALPGVFKSLVNDIYNAFSFTHSYTEVEQIKPLPKDQTKFLKLVSELPYSEVGEIKAYVPEGMIATYLEFNAKLLPVTKYLMSLQSNVLQPYALFLASFLTNHKAGNDTFSNKAELAKLEKQREHYYNEFAKLYAKNSYEAVTQVKKVVDRNADWKQVFIETNECINNLESIDRKLMENTIKQCVGYLELIMEEFSKETDRKVSQEVAHRLSNEAYTIGQELALFSTTYYRALALRGSIENTMKQIQSVFG